MVPALPRLLRLLPALSLLWLYATAASSTTLTMRLTDQDGNAVEDAVLYITTIDGKQAAPAPMQASVDQVDERFVPHVRAIRSGPASAFPTPITSVITSILFPKPEPLNCRSISAFRPSRWYSTRLVLLRLAATSMTTCSAMCWYWTHRISLKSLPVAQPYQTCRPASGQWKSGIRDSHRKQPYS
jgi:hypothetical protein